MSIESRNNAGVDIFQLLKADGETKKKEEKKQILESLGVHDFFEKGDISLNKQTCRSIECRLCIDVCPTHALFWKLGEVGIDENLCVYCTACVLSCIVDDCIRIQRTRVDGEVETFSNPKQVFLLLQNLSSQKKIERTKSRVVLR
jgi:ferredoxin